MATIEVIKKGLTASKSGDIYIGRGSPLGNPYSHKSSNHKQCLYKVDTVEEAIKGFEEHLNNAVLNSDPEICDAINQLIILNKLGQDIRLVCFCKPNPCHGDIIKSFIESQKYCINWFSNMKPLDEPFIYQGLRFDTVENFYQAMKAPKEDIATRKILAVKNPFEAKKYWKNKKPRENFEDDKVSIMRFALEKKFAEGTSWRRKLKYYEGDIIEWNNWGDKFWGKCIFSREGKNWLGRILMEIRASC